MENKWKNRFVAWNNVTVENLTRAETEPSRTQVYFRAGVLEQMEEERGKFVRVKVVTVQRALMGNAKRRPYLRLRTSAIVAQKLWR